MQVHRKVTGAITQLSGELAQLLGQLRSRIVRLAALRIEVVGELVEAVGLAVGSLAHLALLGDHRVLRVRQRNDRHEQRDSGQERDGRSDREPWLEERGHDPERGEGVGPLTPDEPVRLAGLVERLRVGRRGRIVGHWRCCGGREADGQLERG